MCCYSCPVFAREADSGQYFNFRTKRGDFNRGLQAGPTTRQPQSVFEANAVEQTAIKSVANVEYAERFDGTLITPHHRGTKKYGHHGMVAAHSPREFGAKRKISE